jgi:hypothetical protein
MVPSKMQFLVSRICHTGQLCRLPSLQAIQLATLRKIIAAWLQPNYRHRSRKYRHCAALEDDINVCTGQPAGVQPVVASLHHVSRPRLGMLVPVCAHVDSCLFRRRMHHVAALLICWKRRAVLSTDAAPCVWLLLEKNKSFLQVVQQLQLSTCAKENITPQTLNFRVQRLSRGMSRRRPGTYIVEVNGNNSFNGTAGMH